jgi:hypothetical protein
LFLETAAYRQDELVLQTQKAESLKTDLEIKEKELKNLKRELDSKAKLSDEVTV